MKKDIVIGLGEIGMPIYKKLSKFLPVEGLDKNKNLMNEKKNKSLNLHQVDFIHICIPYNKKFEKKLKKAYLRFKEGLKELIDEDEKDKEEDLKKRKGVARVAKNSINKIIEPKF